MSFKDLNLPQKIFILIIGLLSLVAYIGLSIIILLYMYSPKYTGNPFLIVSKKIVFLHENFAWRIPLLALEQGAIANLLLAFGLGLVIAIVFGVALYFARKNISMKKNLHGKAKWSTLADLRKNRLLEDKGIIVGKYQGKLLRFGGQEFTSLGAPTRSGKGVGVVIPNLLDWGNSCVVLDVKQECFSITSKYRANILNQKVYLFDPFSFNTHRYNPFKYLNFDAPDIELQIQALANSLYPAGRGGKDFFILQAQSIFVAITYLFGKLNEENLLWGNKFTLTAMAGALQGIKIDLGGVEPETVELEDTVETAQKMGLLTDTIYSKFRSFFEQAEAKDQFVGVKSSYETPLKVFQDSLFEKATEENDFDFRDLRKEKITIYIGIKPENISTARPILNLFFTQLIYENIRQGLPDLNPELKHNVLMLMDEFTSIGFMEQYQTAIAYMAGYNLRSLIIYQNNTQLSEAPPLGYGDKGAETLLENHSCQVIYRPKKAKTAEEFSKRIGNITTESSNKSFNSKDALNMSRSENQTARALILPQEIMDLKDDEELLFCNSVKIKCKKAFYFNDPYFMDKLKSVSPTLSKVKGLPNKSQLDGVFSSGETAIPLPNNFKSEEALF